MAEQHESLQRLVLRRALLRGAGALGAASAVL
jgi:hypothetical protein